ncbi:MAG TPA: tetratricopeptide repeat protein [Terracidiphilus sp.]|jgi:tetratricopeptide (TPR) repeat protein
MGLREGKWRLRIVLCLAAVLSVTTSARADATVHTNPMNFDPQVKEAYHFFYLLDYPAAVERFKRFHQEHPGDPYATAMLLDAEMFQELYREDLLDTTFYANDGFLSGKHAAQEDQKRRDEIFSLADEAVHEADDRVSKNQNDVDALFARGWARSLKCTYIAMVERGFGSGFRLASKAKDDCERVLHIDPNYVDAKLVVGVYQYVVGALPLPFKLLIGFAGITGSKSKGLELLWDDAHRGPATNIEARVVIALFLRREGKYKDAIAVIRSLEKEYPRDYLFCLEEANLRKDAGEGMGAVEAYQRIVTDNARPGYFAGARLELAYFGLGDALRGQRQYADAANAYETAAASNGVGPELKVRTLLAAGECHDLVGERQLAVKDYQAAIAAGPNTSRADTARKRLKSPYHGN